LANLQSFCHPADLTALVLTHAHADHFSDVDSFLVAARWVYRRKVDGGSVAPIPCLAAPGVRELLHEDPDGILDWQEVGDGAEAEVSGLRLGFSRTDHGPVTLAVRVDEPAGSASGGSSFGYSADSGPEWSFEALGGGIDLALCEASFTKDHEGALRHMSGRQAGRMAKGAGVGRLVLTHRWPNMPARAIAAEASEEMGTNVAQAAIGRGFSI
jgi:ribonuclease BN (tRNA processing enzyme)